MQKNQLDHWLRGEHKADYTPPRLYVISCADVPDYLLAVEYKHQLEPIQKDGETVHYASLDKVKEELLRMGVSSVYLRLHTTDDECGMPEGAACYHDIELSLTSH